MVRAIDNNSIHKYSADTILMVACSGTHLCGIYYTVLNVSAWGVACSNELSSSEMQCDHSHRTDLITSLSCIQHTLVTATHWSPHTAQPPPHNIAISYNYCEPLLTNCLAWLMSFNMIAPNVDLMER